MTVRHPWHTEGVTCDPRPVWKIWDDFKIEEAEMIGFWEDSPAAITDDTDVKVTTFAKENSALLAVGNFSDSPKTVSLKINFGKLGLNREDVKLIASEIQDFQPEKQWDDNDKITIDARKGWIIYLKTDEYE